MIHEAEAAGGAARQHLSSLPAYLLLLHLPYQGLKTASTRQFQRSWRTRARWKQRRNAQRPTWAAAWHGPASRNRATRKKSSGAAEGEDGAALQQGTRDIAGLSQPPRRTLQSPLLTRSQVRDVCTVCSHVGVVRQGSAGAGAGLGGCPGAVTVYPPGRGCLHSAPLATSPGCVRDPSARRQVVRAGRFPSPNSVFLRQRTGCGAGPGHGLCGGRF